MSFESPHPAAHRETLAGADELSPTRPAPAERRRSPRIELLGELYGHVVALDVPLTVRDMSLTGLLIEAPVAFPVGAVHQFSLMLGDDSSIVLSGRVCRCRAIERADDVAWFESGIEFVDPE